MRVGVFWSQSFLLAWCEKHADPSGPEPQQNLEMMQESLTDWKKTRKIPDGLIDDVKLYSSKFKLLVFFDLNEQTTSGAKQTNP